MKWPLSQLKYCNVDSLCIATNLAALPSKFTAYDWYLDELRKLEDNSRHFYELQQVTSEDDGGTAAYKRFKLADEKTFESLFFRQKEMMLKIVKNFTEKTGKYAIKGECLAEKGLRF